MQRDDADRPGGAFHVDAAQSVGKVAVKASPADMLTVAGHKFYGPKGVRFTSEGAMSFCPLCMGLGTRGAILYVELENGISGLRLKGHLELTLPGTLNLVSRGTNSAEIVELLGDRLRFPPVPPVMGG